VERLGRLAGRMVFSPADCREVMAACIQSVAMFGLELWWKGSQTRGTIGQANQLQLLVNQEARATTGWFRTTNLGACQWSRNIYRRGYVSPATHQPATLLDLLSVSPHHPRLPSLGGYCPSSDSQFRKVNIY